MESKFDYIEYANELKKQTLSHVPYELRSKQDFIANKVEEFVIRLAKGFETDNFKSYLDDARYEFVCQVIAEWTFHKSVDLLNSQILPEYYDEILDNIGYVVYEELKQYVDGEISQDNILGVLEVKVKDKYQKLIDDYEKKSKLEKAGNILSFTIGAIVLFTYLGYKYNIIHHIKILFQNF